MPLQLFHATTEEGATAILRNGFRDGEGFYLTETRHSGVWLSDRPLDVNEGAKGDTILSVEFSEGINLSEFECIEDGKSYREWFMPASPINGIAIITRYEPSDAV